MLRFGSGSGGRRRAVLVALLSVTLPTSPVSATTAPATPAQVRALVGASGSIATIPATMAADLPASSNDWPSRVFPSLGPVGTDHCVAATSCVFGDSRSRQTIVLFGDSHAVMWLPAIEPAAARRHWRLIVLWQPTCPVARISHFTYVDSVPNRQCAAHVVASLKVIAALHPNLVVLSERTADVVHTSSGRRFTRSQWQSALALSIRALQARARRVAVIEDVVYLDYVPQTCLARFPHHVQRRCSVRFPNPLHPGQQSAEAAAARVTKAGFIDTQNWFCSHTCSPIIGRMFPFVDQGHISATYAQYLSGVMGSALETLMAH